MDTKKRTLVLLVEAGPVVGSRIVIPAGVSRRVGRTSSPDQPIDLATEDGFMSGVHFEIQNYGDFAEIRDLGSRNKTWVNSASVVTARLSPTDRIRAGKTLFAIQWESTPMDEAQSESSQLTKWSEPLTSSDIQLPVFEDNDHDLKKEPSFEAISRPAVEEVFRPAIPLSESVDNPFASEFETDPSTSDQLPSVQRFERIAGSPFDDVNDAEFVNNFADDSEDQLKGKAEKPFESVERDLRSSRAFRRLRQRRSSVLEFDFSQIAMRLAKRDSLTIVAHFRKIGEDTPKELGGVPATPQFPRSEEILPVLIEQDKWLVPKMQLITNRLVMADGIMLAIVHRDIDPIVALQALSSKGVHGFSEPNGFLTWYWPSHFYALCESLNELTLGSLFGDSVEAMILAVPQIDHQLYALANPRMDAILAEFGFE